MDRAYMSTCNQCRTPSQSQTKLPSKGPSILDPTLYRSLPGCLQYLTFTRPNISFTVQQIFLYMYDPQEPHFNMLKRMLCNNRGTIYFGIHIHPTMTTGLNSYSLPIGGIPRLTLIYQQLSCLHVRQHYFLVLQMPTHSFKV